MHANFWKISAHNYGANGFNRGLVVNGVCEHSFRVPGVECSECTSWGGGGILPIECPEKFKRNKRLLNSWLYQLQKTSNYAMK